MRCEQGACEGQCWVAGGGRMELWGSLDGWVFTMGGWGVGGGSEAWCGAGRLQHCHQKCMGSTLMEICAGNRKVDSTRRGKCGKYLRSTRHAWNFETRPPQLARALPMAVAGRMQKSRAKNMTLKAREPLSYQQWPLEALAMEISKTRYWV